MGYLEQNKKTIDDAFAKALAGMNMTIQIGMESLLDKGMAFCIQEHYENPPYEELRAPWQPVHDEEGGYGWILLHNGMEVKRKLNGDNPVFMNEANEQLNQVKSKAAPLGWVGIILASLREEKYFSVMYEFIPMREAIRDIKTQVDFNEIFKPMSV